MTSMYFFGETENGRNGDYRPEVHDSDGLLVRTGEGEWIWRPLCNSPRLEISRIPVQKLEGFGFLQRDRLFDHYQDLEAHYHQRPSLWIEACKGIGTGSVELVEIPSDSEFNDNMVAFWVPDQPAEKELSFSYSMRWGNNERTLHELACVSATRMADGDRAQRLRFIVDFEGGELESIPPDTGLTSTVEAEGAKVVQKHLEKNLHTGGWRLSFQIEPEESGGFAMFPAVRRIHLKALLKKGENIPEPLTETWTYSFSR